MKIFIFDIDNTISKTKGNKYQIAKPIKSKIKIINRLFDKGHIIKIFTSRYMGKYNGDVDFIKKKYYKRTEIQLKSWGLNKFVINTHYKADLIHKEIEKTEGTK